MEIIQDILKIVDSASFAKVNAPKLYPAHTLDRRGKEDVSFTLIVIWGAGLVPVGTSNI